MSSVVFSAGLTRSGSTLVFNYISEVVEHKNLGMVVSPSDGKGWKHYLQSGDYDLIATKSHRFPDIPNDTEVKAVMTVRDPRAIIVSLMRYWNESFDHVFESGVFRENRENYYDWLYNVPSERFLVFQYEFLMLFPESAISRIGKLIGVDLDSNTTRMIKAKHSLESIRKNNKEFFDRHITHGGFVEWRGIITQEQERKVISEYGNWISAMGYLP